MAAAAVKTWLLLAALLLAAVSATTDEVTRYHGPRRPRPRTRNRGRNPTPPGPAAPSTPAPGGSSRGRGRGRGRVPSPASPTPPPGLLPCNRPEVPPVLAVTAAQNGSRREVNTPCIPTAPPSPPPRRRPAICTCPRPPTFGPKPGGGSREDYCVPLLAPLFPCGPFITGAAEETPTPDSDCCLAVGTFVNSSTAAAAAGLGDGGFSCICPVIVGEVNRVIPRPVDPVRLIYLPIACGVVLPPESLFMCFTGHPSPKVVSKFSQIWEEHGV